MSDLYNRLIELCENKGITGYRMCRDLDIQPSVMTDLKMGRRYSMKMETADKIVEYFGVSVGYLSGRTDDTDTGLVIPDELKGVQVAFHRGEFEDLTQDEIDKLAEFARFIKSQRGEGK